MGELLMFPSASEIPITETSSHVDLVRSVNMENNVKKELDRRRKVAWAAFGPVIEATDQIIDSKFVLTFSIGQPSQRSAMQRRSKLIIRQCQDYCE
ncbi:hypothetical protein KIN20_007049 [Parelaphostrongylus tenuis]|uniref:Uncharacterized protein n=1 Tax=Parelaphostrongylus tenuis TaxID=148309 RepID=A0AAD5M5W5_PARTN|nr:hypothetical protein KIN20_007049 [Parelaphostrongylus tenuis]